MMKWRERRSHIADQRSKFRLGKTALRSAALIVRTAFLISFTYLLPFSSASCMISSTHASIPVFPSVALGLIFGNAASSLPCNSAINSTAVPTETRIISRPSSGLASAQTGGRECDLIASKLIGLLRVSWSPVKTMRTLSLCIPSTNKMPPSSSSGTTMIAR